MNRIYLSLALVLLTQIAGACVCSGFDDPPARKVKSAQIVFLAHISKIDTSPCDGDICVDPAPQTAAFRLIERIKGNPRALALLRSSGGCGWLPEMVPATVLVFTDETGMVSKCSGSRVIDPNSASDLKFLTEVRRAAHHKN